MNVTKPNYYDKFFCIADKCPDTCCALWQVELDLRDAQRYKGYSERNSDGKTTC